ncbi:interferon-induced protein 44-like isoform X2 [Brachyhypopomus gauderio]|uniref:interferon-induced protein 44-like isoform X2 n=1 Tax=Brachyhypopomus gauderio TaxID=698409 RepID=UPI0040415628
MGGSQSKPEFITVLGDKQVGTGEEIRLSCETNTEGLTVTWEKDGEKPTCVQDKHIMKQDGTKCSLQILNADERDEGKYTVKVENKSGTASCSAMVIVELKEWRTVQWKQNVMVDSLSKLKMDNDQVRELNFLLYGPVGAGKSSIINTVKTIFEDHYCVICPVAAQSTKSYTKIYQKYNIRREGVVPLVFHDTMGVEKGETEGVRTDDIISALKGHITEGYVFNPILQILKQNPQYHKNSSLCDMIHCLVNVIPADKIAVMDEQSIDKMKKVGEAASILGIPQVVFLTAVDLACPLTKGNVHCIYRSKKIKENMQKCSNLLGVPVNCIFPVKNYHEEIHLNEDINCLMLDAVAQIIHRAHAFVVTMATNTK